MRNGRFLSEIVIRKVLELSRYEVICGPIWKQKHGKQVIIEIRKRSKGESAVLGED